MRLQGKANLTIFKDQYRSETLCTVRESGFWIHFNFLLTRIPYFEIKYGSGFQIQTQGPILPEFVRQLYQVFSLFFPSKLKPFYIRIRICIQNIRIRIRRPDLGILSELHACLCGFPESLRPSSTLDPARIGARQSRFLVKLFILHLHSLQNQ